MLHCSEVLNMMSRLSRASKSRKSYQTAWSSEMEQSLRRTSLFSRMCILLPVISSEIGCLQYRKRTNHRKRCVNLWRGNQGKNWIRDLGNGRRGGAQTMLSAYRSAWTVVCSRGIPTLAILQQTFGMDTANQEALT